MWQTLPHVIFIVNSIPFYRTYRYLGCITDGQRHVWSWIQLTLIMLTWRIGWAPNNASKWKMGFNLAFKGLNYNLQSTRGVQTAMPLRGYLMQARRPWSELVRTSLQTTNLMHSSFFMYVYFYSLHVSGSHVPIIRRINCINMTSGICHSI